MSAGIGNIWPPRIVRYESEGSGTGDIGNVAVDSNGTRWKIVPCFGPRGTADRQSHIMPDGTVREF